MEKSKFDFKAPEDVIIEVDGQEIKVKPFLDLNQQIALINSYLETYFQSSEKDIVMDEWNMTGAESSLKLAIVDLCSSIAVEGSFENLFYSDLYDIIEAKIVNYWDFKELLDQIVRNVKSQIVQKNSLASLVEKVGVLLGELGESMKNFKPEDLEKLKEVGKELVSSINESPIAKEVFADSQRGK